MGVKGVKRKKRNVHRANLFFRNSSEIQVKNLLKEKDSLISR